MLSSVKPAAGSPDELDLEACDRFLSVAQGYVCRFQAEVLITIYFYSN